MEFGDVHLLSDVIAEIVEFQSGFLLDVVTRDSVFAGLVLQAAVAVGEMEAPLFGSDGLQLVAPVEEVGFMGALGLGGIGEEVGDVFTVDLVTRNSA